MYNNQKQHDELFFCREDKAFVGKKGVCYR